MVGSGAFFYLFVHGVTRHHEGGGSLRGRRRKGPAPPICWTMRIELSMTDSRFPEWQQAYHEALLEVARAALRDEVLRRERIIFTRMLQFQAMPEPCAVGYNPWKRRIEASAPGRK